MTHDEIARLSAPERIALIGELWDSLAAFEPPLTGAQRAELERRLERFEEDRAQAVAWADLKAELAARAP